MLLACVVVGFFLAFQNRSQPNHWKGADPFSKVDAISFYAAGRLALQGNAIAAYAHDVEQLGIVMESAAGVPSFAPDELTLLWVRPGEELSRVALAAGYPDENLPVFVYAPGALPIAAGWATMPWRMATFTLDAISLIGLAFITAWMFGLLGSITNEAQYKRAFAVWSVGVLLVQYWWPVRFGLFTGQISLLCVVAGLGLALPRMRSRGAELLLGGAIAVVLSLKIFPLLLLSVPLARRDWPRLIGAALALAAMLVAGLMIGGLEIHREFLAILGEMGRGARPWAANQSIDACLHRFLYSINFARDWMAIEPAPLRVPIQIATAACAIAAAVWIITRPATDRFGDIALLLALCALVPPIAWSHYGVFFLPAAICLGLRILHRDPHHVLDFLVLAFFASTWAINPEAYTNVMVWAESALGSGPASVLARLALALPMLAALSVVSRLLWLRATRFGLSSN